MALKTICSVPLDWTMVDYARHTCFDGSHVHLSHSQLEHHKKHDFVDYLQKGTCRREKNVVRIELVPVADNSWAGRPSLTHAAGGAMNHGLSFRVGAYLASRVRQKESWAQVMLSQINMRPEREEVSAA